MSLYPNRFIQECQEAQDVSNEANMNTGEEVQISSETLDTTDIFTVDIGTVEDNAIDDSADTESVDNDSGIDNDDDGIDDGMDV